MKKLVVAFLIFICSAITVHYLEDDLLPYVVELKTFISGDQPFTSALKGCNQIQGEAKDWIHPATLSLTVYGTAQTIFEQNSSQSLREVLPAYRDKAPDFEELICVADYLKAHSKEFEGTLHGDSEKSKVLAFPYNMDKPLYEMKAPWVSGLAQSFAGQVMLAAYLRTEDESYLDAARSIANLLFLPISEGGVLVTFNDGFWYEEYASPNSKPPLVLNGHLLSLDFLYWMNEFDRSDRWKTGFDKGLESVKGKIENFHSFAWSFYDLDGNLANKKYHLFHIRQLERYSKFDNSGELKKAASRMQYHLLFPAGVFERLIIQPSNLLFFLVGCFFAIYSLILYFLLNFHSIFFKKSV